MNKVVKNADDAIKGIRDGMTIMLGGFGLCGIPENSISSIVKACITNNIYTRVKTLKKLIMSKRLPLSERLRIKLIARIASLRILHLISQ